MFTIDATIDTIQGAKKQFVNTFVQNETVAKALNEFVDAQSEYTKKAMKTTMDTATRVTQEVVRGATEVSKFDYAKFGEGVMKAYNEMNKQAEKVAKAYSRKAD